MKEEEYIKTVSKKNPDISLLVGSVITDEEFRRMVINQLLFNDYIMVYYHSYLVIAEATKRNPEMFYEYFDGFASMLHYKNSYHRNYALEIISNLIRIDSENKFENIFDEYYNTLYDEKFLTRRYCILNSDKIIKHKPALADKVFNIIYSTITGYDYTDKQRNLLASDFIDLLSNNLPVIKDKAMIKRFLSDEIFSKSDKLKKKTKQLSISVLQDR